MTRCVARSVAAAALVLGALSAAAQPRSFPADPLRGELQVQQPPEVVLNGQPARLAPGARIRGENNLLVLSGALAGQKLTVHYTVDSYGLLLNVWLLSADERARQPWPRTPAEAASWRFDPVAQTWSKP